ncbi:MAG: tetratricopeptide repeat protein [Pirellulaceae bacterium]|nr:tetratricopeptide repeat protein [Pirellulaceae bacterium]
MANYGQNMSGVRAYQEGQPQVALHHFQQVLASDPNNADAYYNMAATYHTLGKSSKDQTLFQQAESLYNRCLDIDNDHIEANRGLSVLLAETNRSDKAFNLLKNWAISSPQKSDPLVELARLYQESGNQEAAKNHLEQALFLDETNPRIHAALGSLREKAGDPQQALANYQRSLQLNRFQDQLKTKVAMLQQQHGLPAASSNFSTGSNTKMVNLSSPTYR